MNITNLKSITQKELRQRGIKTGDILIKVLSNSCYCYVVYGDLLSDIAHVGTANITNSTLDFMDKIIPIENINSDNIMEITKLLSGKYESDLNSETLNKCMVYIEHEKKPYTLFKINTENKNSWVVLDKNDVNLGEYVNLPSYYKISDKNNLKTVDLTLQEVSAFGRFAKVITDEYINKIK